jgi:aspartate-semialdehyde dehydrogenase
MPERMPVAVLAATGSVGQRFVQLLDNHPWFEVISLSGSERALSQTYGEACHWILPEPMPEWARSMPILPTDPNSLQAPLVFSALPADIALEVESAFARAGVVVCSNASAYRRDPDVPILLPEVNPDHVGLVGFQRKAREWQGAIVTNPNCTSTGLTVVLKALVNLSGVRKLFMVSMQAISGAGYPGVASLDILDNVIPYIKGEEEKVEWETRKMLGTVQGDHIKMADIVVSAHTNRVAVSDGHMVCISVELGDKRSIKEIAEAFRNYLPPQISQDLPSTPRPAILLREEPDRPQPRLDRMSGKGMTTVVGHLRPDALLDYKMVVLSHNTIRGAAGGSIYNAELMLKAGYIKV